MIFRGLQVENRAACLVPVNYNNTHWLALCCTPKNAYIFNSIQNLPSEKQVTSLVAPLIRAINSYVTDGEGRLFSVSLPLNFPECEQQQNTVDCGPFVCGFIENIIRGKFEPLFDIDIAGIRRRCNILTPQVRDKCSQTVVGGGGLTAKPPKRTNYTKRISKKNITDQTARRKITANLLRFEYSQMNNLVDMLPLRPNWITLSPQMAFRIAKGDETFIRKNISFNTFVGIDKVLCPICLSDFQWFLIVFDRPSRTSTVFNSLESLTENLLFKIITWRHEQK